MANDKPDATGPATGAAAAADKPAKVKAKATAPVVVPARAEVAYDEWDIQNVTVQGTNIGDDVAHGSVEFRAVRTLPDGTEELGPRDAVRTMGLENTRALAVQYPKLGEAITLMREALFEIAADRRIL